MQEKVIVITGASSGIGKALAIRFAKSGAILAMQGRDQQRLSDTLSEVRLFSPRSIAVTGDVSVLSDCQELIKAAVAVSGRIDVLINNAGISMRGLLEDTSLDVLKKVMEVNFWGMVYCTKLALPYLLDSKGSLVGISSIAGKVGLPGRSAYSASKFAMEGFLQTIRTENMKKGLHVLVACPGFTASGIRNTALGPDGNPQKESPRNESAMMSAETVADKIYRAVNLRKRSLVLTTNGQLTVLFKKIIPAYLDKLIYNHMAKEPGSPFN